MASDNLAPRAPRPLLAPLLALALLVAAPGAARAEQPSAADKETARAQMDRGDEQMEARSYEGALKAYQAADAIMHLPMTGVAVARAQAALGLLVEARDKAMQVARSPVQPGENPAYGRARSEATEIAGALAARIPSIRVTIDKPPADITVAVDGAVIPRAAALELRKVNPGKHVITVTGPGIEPARVDIDVRERAEIAVPVTLVALDKPSPAAPPSLPLPAAPPPPAGAAARGVSPLVYIGFAIGGAGLIVGGITGGVSLARTAALKADCPDGACPRGSGSDLSTANALANVSNITIGVGLAGVALGVVGLFVGGPRAPSPPAVAHIEPWIGAGSIGARGAF